MSSAETTSHWRLEPYGVPTASSEVSRVTGFYTVEACVLCGPTSTVWPAQPTPAQLSEEPLAA